MREVKMQKKARVMDNGKVQIQLQFSDGELIEYILPGKLVAVAAGYGAVRKLGDLANGESDISKLKAEVSSLLANWDHGRWVNRPPVSGTSLVMKALMEHTGKSASEVREFLAGKTMKQKADIKKLPEVAAIVARLKAAEPEPSEDLLEGLAA